MKEWNSFALDRLNRFFDLDFNHVLRRDLVLLLIFNVQNIKNIIHCLAVNGFYEDFQTFTYNDLVKELITNRLKHYEKQNHEPTEEEKSFMEIHQNLLTIFRRQSPEEFIETMDRSKHRVPDRNTLSLPHPISVSKFLLNYIYSSPNRANPALRSCFQGLADKYYLSN